MLRASAITCIVLLTASSSVAGPRRPKSPRDNVMRLAQILDDERTVAELKRDRALLQNGSEKDLLDAVRAYEGLGDPEGAADILKKRAARFPSERAPRIQLAQLFERMGKSESAIPVWQAAAAKFGLGPELTVQYARTLSRLGRLNEALVVLKNQRPAPNDAGGSYWRDVAILAWELDDSGEALDAYRRVWAADHRAPDAAYRLMTLAAEAGARDEARAVALDGYKAEKNPRYLIFVAEQYEKAEDWAAVARTLDVPVSELALFEGREQFWLLRAEAFEHLGNKDAARDAYRAALRVNPSSVPTRLALLWDAIERNEPQTLRGYVDAWRADAEGEPDMWGAYAIALVRLGRTREAVPFFQKRLRAMPDEHLTMVAYADALDQLHLGDAALRVRRHAFAKIRASLAVNSTKGRAPLGTEFHLLEQHAVLSRNLAGAEEGKRWFNYAMANSKPSEYRDDFAVGWYLGGDQPEYARKRIFSPAGQRLARPVWDSYRLTLASTDEDRVATKRLLARSKFLGYSERYHAELGIERDDLALGTIQEQLAKDEAVADEPELRQTQREIFERHAPIGRAGGTYAYVDGLHLAGPDVLVAHDLGSARLLYEGFGREMTSPDQAIIVPERRIEADLGLTLRFQQRDNIFEVGGGANYQPGKPVPHLELYNAREVLRERISTIVNLRINTPIEDTPFLRLAGVRNELQVVGYFGITPRLYMVGEVVGRENTSRTFQHLGSELGGSADLGIHVLRRTPEVNIALRGGVYHRANVSAIPVDLLDTIPFGTARQVETYLPPSYRMVSMIVQVTRGDFFERQRAERLPLPRYDCTAEVGYLMPHNAPAGGVRCSASTRVGSHGYLSLVGSYTLGLLGIEDATLARTSLSYTQFFL